GLRLAMDEKGFIWRTFCLSHKDDWDFLSSIELTIFDQAEYVLMQNWEHVSYVFERLNKMPREYQGADINRIRMSTLNEQAKYFRSSNHKHFRSMFRQTIILSEIPHQDLNALFNSQCHNYKGPHFSFIRP